MFPPKSSIGQSIAKTIATKTVKTQANENHHINATTLRAYKCKPQINSFSVSVHITKPSKTTSNECKTFQYIKVCPPHFLFRSYASECCSVTAN